MAAGADDRDKLEIVCVLFVLQSASGMQHGEELKERDVMAVKQDSWRGAL